MLVQGYLAELGIKDFIFDEAKEGLFEQAAYSELAEGRIGLHQSAEEDACKMVEDQRSDSGPNLHDCFKELPPAGRGGPHRRLRLTGEEYPIPEMGSHVSGCLRTHPPVAFN